MRNKIEGDVVRNPKGLDLPVCCIIAIGGDSFVLSPIIRGGYPSQNKQKWQYYRLSSLPNMKLAKKYPRVEVCPNCQSGLTRSPLGKLTIHDPWKCRLCKTVFTSQSKKVAKSTNRVGMHGYVYQLDKSFRGDNVVIFSTLSNDIAGIIDSKTRHWIPYQCVGKLIPPPFKS